MQSFVFYVIYKYMKKEIHPQYHSEAIIACACGNKIEAGSTVESIHVEICSVLSSVFYRQ